MKEMLGYQVDEVAAAFRKSLSLKLDPTTLIEIAVYFCFTGRWPGGIVRGKGQFMI